MSRAAAKTRTYGIGEVAERFGVAISTLRWWERCGLLTPSGRESGRRRYDEADLRRIAVIQLCQETALMSLDEIRVVLAGDDHDQGWREAVRGRLRECDDQLARLSSARAYLAHMLECSRGDPVRHCPYLAEEVDEYLVGLSSRPNGQVQAARHRARRPPRRP